MTLEARSPGSRCLQVWFLLRPLPLACRWPPSSFVLTSSCLCVYMCLLLKRTPVILDEALPLFPHFNLVTFSKAPSSIQSYSEVWGERVRISTYELAERSTPQAMVGGISKKKIFAKGTDLLKHITGQATR